MKYITKPKSEPKYNMFQTIGFMIEQAWKNCKRLLIFIILYVAATNVINLLQLYLAPVILNKVEQARPIEELLGSIGIFTVGLFFMTGLQVYIECNSEVAQVEIRNHIKNSVNKKDCTMSYPLTVDNKIMQLKHRVNHMLEGPWSAGQYTWRTLTLLLTNLMGFIIYLMLLAKFNWVLIIITVITSFLAYLCSSKIYKAGNKYWDALSEPRSHLRYVQRSAEVIPLAKDIRIFGMDTWLMHIWKNAWKKYMDITVRKEKWFFLAYLHEAFFAFIRNFAVYAYLLYLVLNQGMSAAEFLLYVGAINGFSKWVTGVLSNYVELYKDSTHLSDIKEFLEIEEIFRFEEGIKIPDSETWELQLKNVSFRYPGSDKFLFKNMNLTVHAGEKLAIVGLNGAGKTSLVRLLCGFYDPDEGCVLLNGEDIRQYNRREYYKLFSAVFQEYSQLDITIEQNIAQSVNYIDEKKVWDCLDKAGLKEKISNLPKGLKTTVGRKVHLDGILLSGGETQRMMLARALYKDGPILVLDEPTAALDPLAEHDIYMKYRDMTKEKTSIFISHRLASTRFCDRIIFLSNGKIAEEGTHTELLQKGGQYAELFDVQSQYYQEGGVWNETNESILEKNA